MMIVQQNQSGLISYSSSLVKDVDLAKEIVQEAFLKLWVEIPPPSEGQERPWLFTVCRNAALDWLRRQGMMRSKEQDLKDLIAEVPAAPDQNLQNKSETELLKSLQSVLTESQAEIVRLKFSEDLSYKQIAEVTGLTANHVGVVIHQAVQRMREAMLKSGRIK